MSRVEKIVDSWIAEMEAAGLSYDDMIQVFQMAREKHQAMKNKAPELHTQQNTSTDGA